MPDSSVTAARLQAVHAWQMFTTDRNLKAWTPPTQQQIKDRMRARRTTTTKETTR